MCIIKIYCIPPEFCTPSILDEEVYVFFIFSYNPSTHTYVHMYDHNMYIRGKKGIMKEGKGKKGECSRLVKIPYIYNKEREHKYPSFLHHALGQ